MELLILILLLIIILIIIQYFNRYNSSKEGFSNDDIYNPNDYYLEACPSGLNSFYDNDGNMNCCSGDIIANKCISDRKCVLSSKEIKGVPTCVSLILEEYKEKAKESCPASMSSYFENKNKKGCTNGKLNKTISGPATNTQPVCYIYNTDDDNINKSDSCYNQKLMDDIECFGNNCKKTLISYGTETPPLILITFTDSMGMVRNAYPKKMAINYLNKVWPAWKDSINIDKNINVAEVAKAYFIDKTLSKNDIEI